MPCATSAATVTRRCRAASGGLVIECPLHFAQFDIRTGKFVDGPLATDVPAYEVRVEGDTVYARR